MRFLWFFELFLGDNNEYKESNFRDDGNEERKHGKIEWSKRSIADSVLERAEQTDGPGRIKKIYIGDGVEQIGDNDNVKENGEPLGFDR